MLDKEKILKLAQLYCNSYCYNADHENVILTLEDIDVLLNPNLKVANFSKTAHVDRLTANLSAFVKASIDK
jgi:hypothetical protein